ncbi:MAG: hypothetical protein FMNOHCHN_03417 [Ignavibacteriaceae bacterium]|nr:hypothetical protein [Ignavibacteriaceae bacterium]
MNKLICWWKGHDFVNPYNEGWDCRRCGAELTYHEMVEHLGFSQKNRYRWRKFKEWLICPECGKMFGRHDPKIEHLPF